MLMNAKQPIGLNTCQQSRFLQTTNMLKLFLILCCENAVGLVMLRSGSGRDHVQAQNTCFGCRKNSWKWPKTVYGQKREKSCPDFPSEIIFCHHKCGLKLPRGHLNKSDVVLLNVETLLSFIKKISIGFTCTNDNGEWID